MTPTTLSTALTALGLDTQSAADWLGVERRSVQRWLSGTHEVPGPVVRCLGMAKAAQPIVLARRSLSSRWLPHEDHWQGALSRPITVGQLDALCLALDWRE